MHWVGFLLYTCLPFKNQASNTFSFGSLLYGSYTICRLSLAKILIILNTKQTTHVSYFVLLVLICEAELHRSSYESCRSIRVKQRDSFKCTQPYHFFFLLNPIYLRWETLNPMYHTQIPLFISISHHLQIWKEAGNKRTWSLVNGQGYGFASCRLYFFIPILFALFGWFSVVLGHSCSWPEQIIGLLNAHTGLCISKTLINKFKCQLVSGLLGRCSVVIMNHYSLLKLGREISWS